MPPATENKPPDKTDLIISLAIFAVSVLYYSLYYDAGINWMDEGWLAAKSMRILSGDVAYRDFYEFYSPGQQYLTALLFYLFGANFLITRIVSLFFRAVLNASIYALSRSAAPRSYSLIPAIAVFLAPGPWHKIFFPLGLVTGSALVVYYCAKPSLIRAAIVGAGTAFIFAFRQDVGLFYVCAGAAFIFLRAKENRFKSVAACGLAFAGVTAVWASYFLFAGAGRDLFYQLFFSGAKGVSINTIPYPRPFDPLPDAHGFDLIAAIMGRADFYLPFIIAPTFYFLWIKSGKKIAAISQSALWSVVAVSTVVAFNQIRSRSDFAHLWQIYPVVDLMAMLIIASIGALSKKAAAIAAIVFLGIVGMGAFSSNALYNGSARALERRTERFDNPRMRVLLTPEEFQLIANVESGIKKYVSPGEFLFLAPDIPLFYFLTDAKNPTPWDVVRPGFLAGDGDQLKAARLIDEAEVKLIVIREPAALPPTERRFGDVYRLLDKFIMEKYILAESIGDFHFYVLKNPKTKSNINKDK